jgi:hypothetical protein
VARAEHEYLRRNRTTSREHLVEHVARAAVAYAGICHILSALTAKPLATMVSAAFTGEATPYLALGSSISEEPGSDVKEELRQLRESDLRRAHPGVVFQTPPLATHGGRRGKRLGHCAEGPALLQCVIILSNAIELMCLTTRESRRS